MLWKIAVAQTSRAYKFMHISFVKKFTPFIEFISIFLPSAQILSIQFPHMQYKVTIYILILLAFISFSTSRPSVPTSPAGWRPLFENDSSGHTVYGSKKALLQAIKQGCPIRVAWGEKLPDGTSDIEFSTPDFTTLVNDSDLVIQFPASAIQTDYMNAHKAFLKTNPPITWKALMCTDGHYHQFHQDITTGQVKRIMYLRAFMLWYAFTGPAALEETVPPGTPDMAIPGGIVLDSLIRK